MAWCTTHKNYSCALRWPITVLLSPLEHYIYHRQPNKHTPAAAQTTTPSVRVVVVVSVTNTL